MYVQKRFNFQSIHIFTYLPFFPERAAVKGCTEHQIQQLMFSAGLFHITPGVGLGGLFHGISRAELGDWKWKSCQGHSYYQKRKGILLGLQDCDAVWACACVSLCVCVCVCALGVALQNMANSNAHADGRTEMVSVSKVPLAVWERRDVSAANAFEHSRFQINFPCCLLGRRRWGLGQHTVAQTYKPQPSPTFFHRLCSVGLGCNGARSTFFNVNDWLWVSSLLNISYYTHFQVHTLILLQFICFNVLKTHSTLYLNTLSVTFTVFKKLLLKSPSFSDWSAPACLSRHRPLCFCISTAAVFTTTAKGTVLWIWGGCGSEAEPAFWYQKVSGRLLVRFPWSSCRRVLGQDTERPNCSHCHQCINVCIHYCWSLWTKASAQCPKCVC